MPGATRKLCAGIARRVGVGAFALVNTNRDPKNLANPPDGKTVGVQLTNPPTAAIAHNYNITGDWL